MIRVSLRSVVGRALRGYARLGLSAAGVVAAVAGALAFSALVVFPLWALSTRDRAVYNLLVLLVAAAALTAAVARAVVRRKQSRGERFPAARAKRRHTALRVLGGIAALIAAYFIAALYRNGILAAAIPATLLLLFIPAIIVGRSTTRPRDDGSDGPREEPHRHER